MKWTKEYCGVSHLGEPGDWRRATVERIGQRLELSMWFRGCGFNPPTAMFDSAEDAREAGEKWVASGAQAKVGAPQ